MVTEMVTAAMGMATTATGMATAAMGMDATRTRALASSKAVVQVKGPWLAFQIGDY